MAQNFQKITGTVTAGGGAWPVENARLSGGEISFAVRDRTAAVRYEYTGRIVNNAISGTVLVTGAAARHQLGWEATRVELGVPAHALLKKPRMQDLQQQMQP